MLKITPNIIIEDWEMTEQFIRAGGPGGQAVNKVSSAVELRFHAARSPHLSGPVKSRLKRLAGQRWNKEGEVIIRVDETRHQYRNREIARERLSVLIRAALSVPKARRATKPTYASKIRRIKAKKQRGDLKSLRGKIPDGD